MCVIGPIELMWQEFLRVNIPEDAPKATAQTMAFLKLTYYTSALSMYNTFVMLMRTDTTGEMISMMTEAMRLDITDYFNGQGPKLH